MRKKSSSSVRIFYPRFDRDGMIRELKKKLKDLARKIPLSLVVLFGSYAQGNYTVASDVDLLVVYRGEERKDAFATVKKTLDIPLLEPHVYTESDFERRQDVFRRMIEGGVVLFSRE